MRGPFLFEGTNMTYAKKIVLYCPNGYDPRLDALVEDFIRDGVMFVGVVGKDCSRVEDLIDALVVGDGSKDDFILTSFHKDESIEEVVTFAKSLRLELDGLDVQVVTL